MKHKRSSRPLTFVAPEHTESCFMDNEAANFPSKCAVKLHYLIRRVCPQFFSFVGRSSFRTRAKVKHDKTLGPKDTSMYSKDIKHPTDAT